MFEAIGHLFNIIFSFPIFNALVVLYRLFGDFGLAIIVLTVLIKLILFPLTLTQLRSSKAMQVLQPKIAEIKKKHPGDLQSQSLAMNQLYKEYGVKPMAGCLPMLIQLPVLWGLYYAVGAILRDPKLDVINSELYPFIAPFKQLPDINLNWLTFINPAWHISLGQPDPTHILPILAGLATFVSLRMAQPRNTQAKKDKDKSTPDPMVQSMQTMQYIMPFVTIFIGWSFPAGLALYWTVSSIFQAVQQYFVTGWGALLTAPKFPTGPKAAPAVVEGSVAKESDVSSKKQREKDLLRRSNIEANDSSEEASGPVASQMRTSSRSGSANQNSQRRRPRSSSASARRRGSAQRSRG